MFSLNKNPTGRDISGFGWAMLAGFGMIGTLIWASPSLHWLWDEVFHEAGPAPGWPTGFRAWAGGIAWCLGVSLWVVSRVSPRVAGRIYVGWMTVALPVGAAMFTVLLTVMYFVLLPPFSLIVRRSDPLRKKLHVDGTYWEDHKHRDATLERMKRPF